MRRIINTAATNVVELQHARLDSIICKFAGVAGVVVNDKDEGLTTHYIQWATGSRSNSFKTLEDLYNSAVSGTMFFEL